MAEAVIVDVVRTARGKRNGSLTSLHPMDLASHVLAAIVRRTGIDPSEIEDITLGCVTQTGEQGLNIARGAALAAGLPIEVAGNTINRFCGSGLQAMNYAAQAIQAGAMEIAIGGGVEHMTRVPMGSDSLGGEGPHSKQLTTRYPGLVPQGLSAEMIAERWRFSRTQVDEFAVRSQQLAAAAIEHNRFDREIEPIEVTLADGQKTLFARDEHARPNTTVERLATLKPAFKEGGVIHAGNSSGIVDGAAAVLIMSKARARSLRLKPRAKIVSMAIAGSDPIIMLTGPIPSTQKALAKADLTINDIDLFEINEAFAPVPLAVAKELHIPLEKLNVNGGAIALGHPLGATGAMLVGTVLNELERQDKRRALITLCIGYGMGITTIIDRKID
jgi:acetyl-CoA acyltransferase